MKEKFVTRAVTGIDDKLIRDAYKPAEAHVKSAKTAERRHIGLRRAAVIAVAVVLTVCGLLMLNENVRAAVFGVFVSTRDDGWTIADFSTADREDGSAEAKTVYDVAYGYVPEGLTPHEYHEDDIPDEFRQIDLLNGTEDPYHSLPFATIKILSSSQYDAKFSPGSFEYFSTTTVRGLDGFIIDQEADLGYDFPGGSIIFGDKDVVVQVSGYGISLDEIIAIAENVVW
ncbi:MAG: hypothetical protein IJM71_05420 [Clostridia bacterium]|nr:hypothetical protein [Clostridia bacterium]